jgi:predicted PurR-regulated permease PerM
MIDFLSHLWLAVLLAVALFVVVETLVYWVRKRRVLRPPAENSSVNLIVPYRRKRR